MTESRVLASMTLRLALTILIYFQLKDDGVSTSMTESKNWERCYQKTMIRKLI